LRKSFSPEQENEPFYSILGLIIQDPLSGGLLALLFSMILVRMIRGRKEDIATHKNKEFKPASQETDEKSQKPKPALNASHEPQADVSMMPRAEAPGAKEGGERTEKRSHPRVQWDIPVSLHMDHAKPVTAVIKNLSLGGAFAVCDDFMLFKPGVQGRFNLSLSDKDRTLAINSKVEIVRVTPDRGLGLKFLDLKGNSLNYLRQVLA
jgi:hypothetical protein